MPSEGKQSLAFADREKVGGTQSCWVGGDEVIGAASGAVERELASRPLNNEQKGRCERRQHLQAA